MFVVRYFVFVFLFMPILIVASVNGQSLWRAVSTGYTSLGAYSQTHGDVFSFVNNPAALMQFKSYSIGVFGEKRFMLKELGVYQAALVMPTKKMGNWGVNVSYVGYAAFNENKLSLAYARSLGNIVNIGLQFNYHGYRIPGYLSDNAITAELGCIIKLSDVLTSGVHVFNPIGAGYNKTGDKITSEYSIGLGYDASDRFFISGEIVQTEGLPVNVIAGCQYNFHKQFFARLGISTVTSQPFCGFGVAWKKLRLDVTGSYHPQLGISPGLMLVSNFSTKAD